MQVKTCLGLSAQYNKSNDPEDLRKLEEVVESLDPAESILFASCFSHMLTLGNIAGEGDSPTNTGGKWSTTRHWSPNSATLEKAAYVEIVSS